MEGFMGKQVASIGRVVHYVLPDSDRNTGEHRPALVVRVWDEDTGLSNLHVFADGNNDTLAGGWVGSIYQSDEPKPNTWHFPEYVPARES
jgi:hypothetical protein